MVFGRRKKRSYRDEIVFVRYPAKRSSRRGHESSRRRDAWSGPAATDGPTAYEDDRHYNENRHRARSGVVESGHSYLTRRSARTNAEELGGGYGHGQRCPGNSHLAVESCIPPPLQPHGSRRAATTVNRPGYHDDGYDEYGRPCRGIAEETGSECYGNYDPDTLVTTSYDDDHDRGRDQDYGQAPCHEQAFDYVQNDDPAYDYDQTDDHQGFDQIDDRGYDQNGDPSYSQTNDQSYSEINDQSYGETDDQGYDQTDDQGYDQTDNMDSDQADSVQAYGQADNMYSEQSDAQANDMYSGETNDQADDQADNFGPGQADFQGQCHDQVSDQGYDGDTEDDHTQQSQGRRRQNFAEGMPSQHPNRRPEATAIGSHPTNHRHGQQGNRHHQATITERRQERWTQQYQPGEQESPDSAMTDEQAPSCPNIPEPLSLEFTEGTPAARETDRPVARTMATPPTPEITLPEFRRLLPEFQRMLDQPQPIGKELDSFLPDECHSEPRHVSPLVKVLDEHLAKRSNYRDAALPFFTEGRNVAVLLGHLRAVCQRDTGGSDIGGGVTERKVDARISAVISIVMRRPTMVLCQIKGQAEDPTFTEADEEWYKLMTLKVQLEVLLSAVYIAQGPPAPTTWQASVE
ncbi:hypothetical protein JDV02_003777 [Purpureocillium takamizusanense]|uniref:Uncharacterized protein n=1 Tax=Purpureocillium takamizusanense TaxID=2060973 RepID=A0A9Q8VA20_9HYPO|nr:uncharacterized protein JDV02_003777 [Purpureocillium takamizusanense]UNI17434.1 hypothetical protein JDV02_003777 [Purpureocillium takamizusanense]